MCVGVVAVVHYKKSAQNGVRWRLGQVEVTMMMMMMMMMITMRPYERGNNHERTGIRLC
jgi:hypothetical protein